MKDLTCSVNYQVSSSMFGDSDGDNFISVVNGEVVSFEDDDAEVTAAKVRFIVVDVEGCIDAGWDLPSLLDIQSETAPYIQICNDDDLFLEEVEDLLINNFNFYDGDLRKIFIVDRLEILPAYRGKGLSENIINDGVKIFGSDLCLVALRCFPLQYEEGDDTECKWRNEMHLDQFSQSEEHSAARLKTHYQSLGFLPVPFTDIMVRM